MYRVYRNHAAALIHPLIVSFFFLTNVQALKLFSKLFSRTVRPIKLKRSTHVDSGQMYRVKRNQAAAVHSSFYFFIFLYSPALKELGLYWTCLVLPSLCDSVILWFSHSVTFQMKLLRHTFFRNCEPRRWKLGTHVDNGQMYRFNGVSLLLLIRHFISLFFFITKFQTLKIFVTLVSRNVRHRRFKLGTNLENGWMYRVYRN